MKYKIVYASGDGSCDTFIVGELNQKVNDLIKNGWKPLGGVSVTRSDQGFFSQIIMAQAMIKKN